MPQLVTTSRMIELLFVVGPELGRFALAMRLAGGENVCTVCSRASSCETIAGTEGLPTW